MLATSYFINPDQRLSALIRGKIAGSAVVRN
jgi:hypothetical protein